MWKVKVEYLGFQVFNGFLLLIETLDEIRMKQQSLNFGIIVIATSPRLVLFYIVQYDINRLPTKENRKSK